MKGEETGLDLNLLPPADNLAFVVETSQHQHLHRGDLQSRAAGNILHAGERAEVRMTLASTEC